jgi:hypothetical protein
MDKDRQIYQMQQKGFKAIEDKLADMKPKDVQKIEIIGDKQSDDLAKLFFSMLQGKPGYTPEKGKDYFTEADIQEITKKVYSLIKIPDPIPGEKGDPGKDAEIDYVWVEDKIKSLFANIKIPDPIPGEPGKPGKDAKVDYEKIISSVLKKIPNPEKQKEEISTSLKDFAIKEIQKTIESTEARYTRLNSAGPTTRLNELVDVDIPTNPSGTLVLTWNPESQRWVAAQGGGIVLYETPTGDVDGVNTTFIATHQPSQLFIDGVNKILDVNYTYNEGVIEITDGSPPWNSIISYYNS